MEGGGAVVFMCGSKKASQMVDFARQNDNS